MLDAWEKGDFPEIVDLKDLKELLELLELKELKEPKDLKELKVSLDPRDQLENSTLVSKLTLLPVLLLQDLVAPLLPSPPGLSPLVN